MDTREKKEKAAGLGIETTSASLACRGGSQVQISSSLVFAIHNPSL